MKKPFIHLFFAALIFLPNTAYLQELPLEYRAGSYLIDRSPPEEYRERRMKLMDMVGDGIIVLVGKGDARGYDDGEDLSQEINFFYFTGVEIPNAVLFLFPKERKEILFLPERNKPLERWTGPKIGIEPAAEELFGFEDIRPTHGGEIIIDARRRPVPSWTEVLRSYIDQEYTLHLILRGNDSYEHTLTQSMHTEAPWLTVNNISNYVTELRRTKSKEELRLLQRAVDITMDAHRQLARAISHGKHEYEVEAVAEYVFRKNGAEGPAFPSIVASGFFSTALHYSRNTRQMIDGEVVKVDIGARFGFYSSDLTRTYPVSGKFTPRQRELYEIVLDAQNTVLESLRPGISIFELRRIAYNFINSHGADLHGNPLGQYFVHGLSHFVGLQVHDVGSEHAPLRAGDVITIEPGIYIPEENIGIRIEDMFLVTEDGFINMSEELPRKPDEIEKLMRKR